MWIHIRDAIGTDQGPGIDLSSTYVWIILLESLFLGMFRHF